jgi:enoyl-CoA hydratase
MGEELKVSAVGDVQVVTLNRPDRLNALTLELVAGLSDVLADLAGQGSRAIVLTGEGRGFCAGLDLAAVSEAQTLKPGTPADRLANQRAFARMVRTIRRLPVPVVAAVNGAAAGAGMALALAADIRVMDESAKLHPAALKMGLSAGECGMSYLLPRLIGSARAFEILLTARPVSAAEAIRIGLACELTPGATALETALGIAQAIVQHDAFAVELSKSVLWANLDANFEDAVEFENRTQVLASLSDATARARDAFLRGY